MQITPILPVYRPSDRLASRRQSSAYENKSCNEKHLKRYLAEFDFRYNEREGLGINDNERTVAVLSGIVGKRLTYRDSLTVN